MVMTGPGLASCQPWTAPIAQATGFFLRLQPPSCFDSLPPIIQVPGSLPVGALAPEEKSAPRAGLHDAILALRRVGESIEARHTRRTCVTFEEIP